MDASSAKLLAAAIALLPIFGVGIGLGNIFSNWLAALARNPGAAPVLQKFGFIGFALTEALAIFALVISFLILFGK